MTRPHNMADDWSQKFRDRHKKLKERNRKMRKYFTMHALDMPKFKKIDKLFSYDDRIHMTVSW